MKTDKSCQLAVLPHNLLTAFLSSKKKKRKEKIFQSHRFSSDIHGLLDGELREALERNSE